MANLLPTRGPKLRRGCQHRKAAGISSLTREDRKIMTYRESGPSGPGEEKSLKVRVSAVIKEALFEVRPGEDFDEALLRALKAKYPVEAAALLSALTRIIELEAQRAKEDKEQTIRRLAEASPGPEIVLRTRGGEVPTTTIESTTLRIGDKEYHSLEEVPPHSRAMIEKAKREKMAGARKSGCLSMLLGGWLISLLRGPGR